MACRWFTVTDRMPAPQPMAICYRGLRLRNAGNVPGCGGTGSDGLGGLARTVSTKAASTSASSTSVISLGHSIVTWPWSRYTSRRAMGMHVLSMASKALASGHSLPLDRYRVQSGRVSVGRLPHFEQRSRSLTSGTAKSAGRSDTLTDA
jgi:hypothetical protein